MTPAWIDFGFETEAKGVTPPWFNQVHGRSVVDISTTPVLKPTEADAGFTHLINLPIHVFTADCIPILLFGDEKDPIAAIHCGWRGALAGVVNETLKHFSGDVEAIIGPAIGACCFEVREDFVEAFESEGLPIRPYLSMQDGRMKCDLLAFVTQTQLSGLKVHREHWRCTVCSEPRLPSYRRTGSADPRIRSWIRKVGGANA